MEGLLLLAVSHHETVLKLPEALLLEIQTVMNELFFMKYSRDALTTVPVAVLIILDDFVNVNGLIKVIEGFFI